MLMPMDGTPRVEIIERRGEDPIAGSNSVSAALFIGPASAGPALFVQALPADMPQRPVLVTSWDDYVRTFGAEKVVGPPDPFLQGYFLSHAVRGFFANGGRQAYVLRLSTGAPRLWLLNKGVSTLFRVGTDPLPGSDLQLSAPPAVPYKLTLRTPSVQVQSANVAARTLTLAAAPAGFFPGDRIAFNGATATITAVDSGTNTLSLSAGIALPGGGPASVTLADVSTTGSELRVPYTQPAAPATLTENVVPGAVVKLTWRDAANNPRELWSLVSKVDTFGRAIYLVPDYALPLPLQFTAAATPELTVSDFGLTLTADGQSASLTHLSPVPWSPNYVGTRVAAAYGTGSNQVPRRFSLEALALPPSLADWVPTARSLSAIGADDQPASLTALHYSNALETLQDFDLAKLLVVADAAAHRERAAIVTALRDHCDNMRDRMVLIDAPEGQHDAAQLGADVAQVRSARGLAAYYYPWVEIPNPSRAGDVLLVPPSGHVAGMFARVDRDRGVHKTPANETLNGALDVEKRLGDNSQGPLHDQGINVLRVFRGNASINVFGGRTTVESTKTDFRYIGVRRLFLFVEDALMRALREKLYEPNDERLWKALRRTISEFLGRLQAGGAIFGSKPEEGFWVQIDSGNNPESQRKLGILNIRIGIRPNYPAEYIVVEIGVWDGKVTITEA